MLIFLPGISLAIESLLVMEGKIESTHINSREIKRKRFWAQHDYSPSVGTIRQGWAKSMF
jgi:hypothetical protein